MIIRATDAPVRQMQIVQTVQIYTSATEPRLYVWLRAPLAITMTKRPLRAKSASSFVLRVLVHRSHSAQRATQPLATCWRTRLVRSCSALTVSTRNRQVSRVSLATSLVRPARVDRRTNASHAASRSFCKERHASSAPTSPDT